MLFSFLNISSFRSLFVRFVDLILGVISLSQSNSSLDQPMAPFCGTASVSLSGSKDFQIAVIGVEPSVSASGDFFDNSDLCQFGK